MRARHLTQVAVAAVLSLFLASAGYAQPYSSVHVFGNSNVDVGNSYLTFYENLGMYFPPSPPYLEGRHSNGPVFPEVIAGNLRLGPLTASLAGGTNHAYGGARSVVDVWYLGFIRLPSVRSQVQDYLAEVGGAADPEALYFLHDGGNDVTAALDAFFSTGDWESAAAIVEESAQGMIGSVQMLANAGGVHFVVPNAPYLSKSAWTCGQSEADILAAQYNAILKTGLAALGGGLRVVYFDLAGFADALSSRFTTGCSRCVPFFDLDPLVCSNPDELFYWDDLHFTAPVNQLVGDAITVAMLKDHVLGLAAAGVLNEGNSSALLAKLNAAYEKLEERRPKTAANQILAFANQVTAFVRTGQLSAEQAELLLVGAYGIIDQS